MARVMTRQQRSGEGQFAMKMLAPALARPATRERLAPRYGAANAAVTIAAAPADDSLPPSRSTYLEESAADEPFGAWLLRQKDKGGLIGALAAGAAADRGFSKTSDPDKVRARLIELQADGDMHAALDDAEIDWLAL